jgi:acyl-coenzyme A synthetase/AMP-(fatty) acid ligase
MRLLTVGAALSGELRERARRVLNAEVESNYGCNESGGIGQIDSSGIGHLFPGTDMKVVDAHQHELAHGSPGVIWVRSQEIADGYTDAANSQAHFIDGWFVTGDHGVMLDARTFRLLGRVDTLINLGGHKVAPDAFEACLVALGLARDLAVTSIPGAQGIEQFCVCLEGLRVSEPELRAGIRSVFGAHTGHIAVVLVEKIHRNAAGKIQRQQMQQLAVSLASGHANK